MRTRNCLLATTLALTLSVATADTLELVTVVNEDGRTALQYMNGRWVGGGVAIPTGAYDEGYEYFFPAEHHVVRNASPGIDTVQFDGNSVSTLANIGLDSEAQGTSLTRDSNGTFHFVSATTEYPEGSGGKGYWTPNGWDMIVYAFKLPPNLEFKDFLANKNGNWVRRENTATFFGANINHVVFNVSYRSKLKDLCEQIRSDLSEQKETRVECENESVTVVIGATVLFASGSAKISSEGNRILQRFVTSLNRPLNIIVEGHTDNDPISGALADVFPSNWHLSAARSLFVLERLIELGIPEKRMHIRAFGEFDPLVSNDSPKNKAQNRRIQLLLTAVD